MSLRVIQIPFNYVLRKVKMIVIIDKRLLLLLLLLLLRLNFQVHARWDPRLLKDFEKDRRVKESRAFLRRYRKEGNDFLDRIITTDETWMWFYNPEMKGQSAVWNRSGSPPPEKARGANICLLCFATGEVWFYSTRFQRILLLMPGIILR